MIVGAQEAMHSSVVDYLLHAFSLKIPYNPCRYVSGKKGKTPVPGR
jgi:hypothetical protein